MEKVNPASPVDSNTVRVATSAPSSTNYVGGYTSWSNVKDIDEGLNERAEEEFKREEERHAESFYKLVKEALERNEPVLEIVEGLVLDKINEMLDEDTDALVEKLVTRIVSNSYTADSITTLKKKVRKLEKSVEKIERRYKPIDDGVKTYSYNK